MSASTFLRSTTVLVLLLLFAGAIPAGAELQNHGPDGEYFHDTVTGLYWFDPANFHEQARITLDLMADYSTTWSWATSGEVDALLNQVSPVGSTIEDVIGPRHSTITGGMRWLGFYFGSGDDGWLVQSENEPFYTQVTTTGSQANAYHLGGGAWFVSAVDPVTSTAVLEDDGIYFHDLSTDLYWFDPAEFFGYPRSGVLDWLSANTDWRWATEDEVYGLLGKTAVTGDAIEDVMGTRSMTVTGDRPRWVGYYVMDSIINGLLLQADIDPNFTIVTTASTQAGAQNFNPGAWLVSDVDPTPNEDASWGDVKRSYK
jgi:hypothetical protein